MHEPAVRHRIGDKWRWSLIALETAHGSGDWGHVDSARFIHVLSLGPAALRIGNKGVRRIAHVKTTSTRLRVNAMQLSREAPWVSAEYDCDRRLHDDIAAAQ